MSKISGEQAQRILEDLQRDGMLFNIMKERAEEKGDKVMCGLVSLAVEQKNALYNDIKGMMNGNTKNKGSEVE